MTKDTLFEMFLGSLFLGFLTNPEWGITAFLVWFVVYGGLSKIFKPEIPKRF